MRVVALLCVLALAGCVGSARKEGFAQTGPNGFIYSAHTNTVMTENDDGVAERIRRDWIADCAEGARYVRQRLCRRSRAASSPRSDGPFGNGGDIVYAGRCVTLAPPY